MKIHYVVVRRYDNDKEVFRRGPFDAGMADKIDDGLNINLNHDEFYTVIDQDLERLQND